MEKFCSCIRSFLHCIRKFMAKAFAVQGITKKFASILTLECLVLNRHFDFVGFSATSKI